MHACAVLGPKTKTKLKWITCRPSREIIERDRASTEIKSRDGMLGNKRTKVTDRHGGKEANLRKRVGKGRVHTLS